MLVFATASASIHPIPLDKNTTPKACLDCHADKSTGKVVHSAIAKGCLSCHEVRVNREATYVKLITATPYKLCISCHAEKDASKIQGTVHPPAIRDCLDCHDPHSSNNPNELLKPTSGDAQQNLCLSCHTEGLDVPAHGSRHEALDTGCDTCHTIHKTGPEPTVQNRYHLTEGVPQLCIDCHTPNDTELQKAHDGQPFAGANCLQCHDAHQSAEPNLAAKFLHPPFAEKKCDTCHSAAKEGKVVLVKTDVNSLCGSCHDQQVQQIANAKFPHVGAQTSDCTDCHDPHASAQPSLPKGDAVNVCLGCHTDQAAEEKKAVLHQPVFQQGCATCHEGHGGNDENLLRAQGNALCLACHGPDSNPARDAAKHELTIFGGKVELPEDYFTKNRVFILPLQNGVGHPVANHPVQDVVDPTDSSKVLVKLSCLSCHQPHASAQPGLLLKDQADNMTFCDTCHKNRLEFGAITPSPAPGAKR